MELDKDLRSVQEVRDLVKASKAAGKVLAVYDAAKIDAIVQMVAAACDAQAERLGAMAVEETGFGVPADKALKNKLGSSILYDSIKGMKTIGIIAEDKEKRMFEVAVPVGVVAALIPSTNPTSTTMFKAIIALKGANTVIFSPHPNAVQCVLETVRVIRGALQKAGAPEDAVLCITEPTIQATNELMGHSDTGVILATGGPGMVRAAYNSGNPAIGVGAGNGPAFIERSADVPAAIRHIFESKTFDNGTICASEQSIVTERCLRKQVLEEVSRQGGYLLNDEESKKVARILLRANGFMNPAIVGKPANTIAQMAGVDIPEKTRVLLSEQTTVGEDNPYSREKLCPVLGFYVEEDWERACERCMEILHNEGVGHTMTIHSQDEAVIREFALKKPVMRLLVNTPAALGGVGVTTSLAPSLTLGCGAVGGSATSDNVTPMHLINIRRIAYGVRELDEIRGGEARGAPVQAARQQFSQAEIERIAAEVILRITNSKL